MINHEDERIWALVSIEERKRLAEIDEMLQYTPYNIDLLLEKGFILHDGALDDKAVKVYKEILKFDPNNLQAYIWLFESLWMLGDYIDLKRVTEEALKIYPNQAVVYKFLAYAVEDEYFRQGKKVQEPCFSYLRKSIELAPDWMSTKIALIEYLIRIENFKSALHEIEEAFKYIKDDFPIPKSPMEDHYERFITRRVGVDNSKKILNKFLDEINAKLFINKN